MSPVMKSCYFFFKRLEDGKELSEWEEENEIRLSQLQNYL